MTCTEFCQNLCYKEVDLDLTSRFGTRGYL